MKYNVAFMGDQGSGKTSLIARKKGEPFLESLQSTIGVPQTKINHNETDMLVYDVTGNPFHAAQSPKQSDKLNLIVYCVDLSQTIIDESNPSKIREEIQEKIEKDLENIKREHPLAPVVFVGTKEDEQLNHNNKMALYSLADDWVITSAKDNKGIEDLFDLVTSVAPNKAVAHKDSDSDLQKAFTDFLEQVKQAPKLTPAEKRALEFEAQNLGFNIQKSKSDFNAQINKAWWFVCKAGQIIDNSQLQDKPRSKLKLALSTLAVAAVATLVVGAAASLLAGLTFGLSVIIPAVVAGVVAAATYVNKPLKEERSNQGFFKVTLNQAASNIRKEVNDLEEKASNAKTV